jgi:hypothetical protein
MKQFGSLLLALAALVPSCYAVETKSWIQNDQTEFEKGTLTKVSLRSDGRLTLAPVFHKIFDSSTPYLWALAEDSKGNLFTGGGGPSASVAKLFEIDRNGKSRAYGEVPGMEIHAIAVNSRDQVFAATSPDGKVYRFNAAGKPELFYDPHAKYIWALVFDSKGNLYVATGDQGEVHRVTPDGHGSVFFRTEETHARSMAVDANDNLIVGTEPGGLIMRISPAGEGFVLYQAGKREVTAVSVAKNGIIYAAAVGSKPTLERNPPLSPGQFPSSIPIPPLPTTTSGVRLTTSGGSGSPASISSSSGSGVSGGSEVYRIEKDNYARKVWSNAQDIAYAIGFDADGRPVVGTGNKGKVYRIDSDIVSTLLFVAQPTQITSLLTGVHGKLFAACGNIGEVYQIGPEIETEGTFESEPFDVGSFSYWGRLTYKGGEGNGRIALETRSGNVDRPQKNWSPWAPVDLKAASRVTSPSARFLQYRAVLRAGNGGASPEVDEVEVAYMSKNVAPLIEQIEITPVNYKFQPATSLLTNSPQTLTLPAIGQKKRNSSTLSLDLGTQSMQYAKGFMGARWAVTDANADEMVYRVEIRGAREKEWKLLREKLREKYLSWDSTAYPDGGYVLRVIASDAPSNPPGEALTNQLESDPFIIDNTPPQIIGLTGAKSGSTFTVRWKAKDALSVVDKAEYSIDGKEWAVIEPTTRLSDSLDEDYVLVINDIGAGEHTVAVRVQDEFDNQSVSKIVVR